MLDPACGSGGFLVTVLDHVRHKITRNLYPELDEVRLAARVNTPEVDELVRNYAEKMIFWLRLRSRLEEGRPHEHGDGR